MATIFPLNPNINDEYSGYRWDGTAWKIMGVDLTAQYQPLVSSVSNTELGYLDGVTSGIQSQLNSKITASSTNTLTNKTIGDALVFNNGGTNQTIYAGGQDFTIYGDHTVYINTVSGDVDLQPAGGAKIWGAPIATQSYVSTAISNVIDAAPTALNTLNELAAALGDDANFASTMTTALGSKLDSSTASSTYAPLSSPTFSGTVNFGSSSHGIGPNNGGLYITSSGEINLTYSNSVALPSSTSIGSVSSTEIGYLDGVTSAIQTQISAKAPTNAPTFTGGVIVNNSSLAFTDASNNQLSSIALDNSLFTGTVQVMPGSLATGNQKITIDPETSGKIFITAKYGDLILDPYNSDVYIFDNTSGNEIATKGAVANEYLSLSSASSTYAPLSGATFTGNIIAPEVHATGKLVGNTVGNDEGGEILLGKAATNTTLTGDGVTIDVYRNKLRIFEQGGNARGGYFDISTLSNGVGTNLTPGQVNIIPSTISVSTGSATAASNGEITFTNANNIMLNGIFTSSYDNYKVIITFTNASNSNVTSRLRMSTSGSVDSGANYYYAGPYTRMNGGSVGNWWNSGGGYLDLGTGNSSSSYYHNVVMDITSPKLSVPTLTNWMSNSTDTTSLYSVIATGIVATTSSYDGFNLFTSAGTFSGKIRVYGYNNG